MPTYEYRCPQGHDFEHFFRSINSSETRMACPECGQIAERRVSGGAGLLFKGSGFYITDYGKDGKKDQRSKTSAGESKPTSTDAGSSKSESTSGGSSDSSGGSSSGSSSGSSDSSSASTTPKKSDSAE